MTLLVVIPWLGQDSGYLCKSFQSLQHHLGFAQPITLDFLQSLLEDIETYLLLGKSKDSTSYYHRIKKWEKACYSFFSSHHERCFVYPDRRSGDISNVHPDGIVQSTGIFNAFKEVARQQVGINTDHAHASHVRRSEDICNIYPDGIEEVVATQQQVGVYTDHASRVRSICKEPPQIYSPPSSCSMTGDRRSPSYEEKIVSPRQTTSKQKYSYVASISSPNIESPTYYPFPDFTSTSWSRPSCNAALTTQTTSNL